MICDSYFFLDKHRISINLLGFQKSRRVYTNYPWYDQYDQLQRLERAFWDTLSQLRRHWPHQRHRHCSSTTEKQWKEHVWWPRQNVDLRNHLRINSRHCSQNKVHNMRAFGSPLKTSFATTSKDARSNMKTNCVLSTSGTWASPTTANVWIPSPTCLPTLIPHVSDRQFVMYMLNGHSEIYDFILNVIKQKSPPPTFETARSMLQMEEDRLSKLPKPTPNPANNASSPNVFYTTTTTDQQVSRSQNSTMCVL